MNSHDSVMQDRENRREMGLPIAKQSECWPHRFKDFAFGGKMCLDCGGYKCVEPGCRNLAGPNDLCPEHEGEEA
jgi:hypothetical protein